MPAHPSQTQRRLQPKTVGEDSRKGGSRRAWRSAYDRRLTPWGKTEVLGTAGGGLQRDELIELRAGAPTRRTALRYGPARFAERLLRPPTERTRRFASSTLALRERLIPAALQVAGEPRREQRDDEEQHTERDDRPNQHCIVNSPIGPVGNVPERRTYCRTSGGREKRNR